jgi:hypothetical protein
MKPLIAANFGTPGTVEYVLAKAGLYQLTPESGFKPRPTEALRGMFPRGAVAPEEKLVPHLAQIIDLSDRLGAVNRAGERSRIIDALRQLGITHEHGAISQLFAVIRQATQEAAEDVAKLPPARGL